MTKQIHNLIILDESGSMQMIKRSTIKGFNHITKQINASEREFNNQQHFVSLATFNGSKVGFKLFNQHICELVALNKDNYHPDGTTPLYDAICTSVFKLKHVLSNTQDYGVLVTVITDGLENSSKEFSLKETKYLIETMSDDARWGFGLIGANIDLYSLAKSLSIPRSRVIEFESNEDSVDKMFKRYGAAQTHMSNVFSNNGDFRDDIPF